VYRTDEAKKNTKGSSHNPSGVYHLPRNVFEQTFNHPKSSLWRPETIDSPQGWVLGPAPFNISVSNMDSGIECTLSNFTNDTKLSGAVDRLEGRDAIQSDPDRLERWACANLTKFNKAKCKVLCMAWGNPKHKYRLGPEWTESSPEKDLGCWLKRSST